MTIRWDEPIEAVHASGMVAPAAHRTGVGYHHSAEWSDGQRWRNHEFYSDGRPWPGMDGWCIRNVAEPAFSPPQLSPEVVERMVALVRRLLLRTSSYLGDEANEREDAEMLREARAILAEIEPVDEDEREAAKLVAGRMYRSTVNADRERALVLAAIRRGRQLAAQEVEK